MRLGTLLLAILILMLTGCSGGSNTPLTNEPAGALDNLPIIGASLYDNGGFQAIGVLGAYEVTINPDTASAELIAKRTPAIGEDYIVSGAGFFTVAPCSSCLKLLGFGITPDGNAQILFNIRHPFQPGNPANPPSAINRLDLDVFDLAAVIVPKEITATNYPLMGTDLYKGLAVGADGYTKELSSVLSDDGAMPYFLVIDDTVGGTSTWNKFGMGANADFDVSFNLSAGTLSFDMYLTMGYGASAKKAQRLTPTYYNPEFNRKSAWKVVVTPPQGTNPPAIGNTWQDNDPTTTFNVQVEVYDWQIGATVDSTLADPASVFAASNVGSVSVEIPGMNSTLPAIQTPDPAGTGMPGSPLVFMVPVANENLLPAGSYLGLVKVADERLPLTPADGRDFLIDTPDGVALNNYTMGEYATYQTFPATVVVGCGPITGQILTPTTCPTDLATGATVDFTVSASSANDGDPIVLYEVDFDYDGTNFTTDATSTDGVFDAVGPFVNDSCPADPPPPQDFTVAFRATDSCTPPNITIFASCTCTVSICCQAVGDVTVAINRGEGGQKAQRITSITLDWTYIAGCAEEFVIERASDGFNGTGWAPVGTAAWPATDYKYVLSGVDWDTDYRFRVIAREVAGDPGSAFPPSQEVFVLFISNAGQSAGNGWPTYQENGNFYMASWGGGCDVDDFPSPGNNTALGFLTFSGAYTNCWAISRTSAAIPDLVGQSTAFCDGYWSTMGSWGSTMGLTVGTMSITAPSGATVCDYDPASTLVSGHYAYNINNIEGLNNEFCETNQAGWGGGMNWQHIGYYLEDLLDNGPRDYIAFGAANGSVPPPGFAYGWSDGWAFVVY